MYKKLKLRDPGCNTIYQQLETPEFLQAEWEKGKQSVTKRKKPNKPRKTCPDCKGELIVRAGEVMRPHFAHLKQSNCPYTERRSGETEDHRNAKWRLCSSLNNKECNIRVITKCKNCRSRHSFTIPLGKMVFNMEIAETRHEETCIWDILGENDDGEKFGIEIKKTHKTDDSMVRNCTKWIEVDAESVIMILDHVQKYDTDLIELENIRHRCFDKNKCDARVKLKKDENENTDLSTIKKEEPESIEFIKEVFIDTTCKPIPESLLWALSYYGI
jgi:hypothetical protein